MKKPKKGTPEWVRLQLIELIEYSMARVEDPKYIQGAVNAISCLRLHDLDRNYLSDIDQTLDEPSKRWLKLLENKE